MKRLGLATLVFVCLLVNTFSDQAKRHSNQIVNGAVGWTGLDVRHPYPQIIVGVLIALVGLVLYLIDSGGHGGIRLDLPWRDIFRWTGFLAALAGSVALLAGVAVYQKRKQDREDAQKARERAEETIRAAEGRRVVERLAAPASTRVGDGLSIDIDSADLARTQTIVRVIVRNDTGDNARFRREMKLTLYDARNVEIWSAKGKEMGGGSVYDDFNRTEAHTSKIFAYRFTARTPDRAPAAGKISFDHYLGWVHGTEDVSVPFLLR